MSSLENARATAQSLHEGHLYLGVYDSFVYVQRTADKVKEHYTGMDKLFAVPAAYLYKTLNADWIRPDKLIRKKSPMTADLIAEDFGSHIGEIVDELNQGVSSIKVNEETEISIDNLVLGYRNQLSEEKKESLSDDIIKQCILASRMRPAAQAILLADAWENFDILSRVHTDEKTAQIFIDSCHQQKPILDAVKAVSSALYNGAHIALSHALLRLYDNRSRSQFETALGREISKDELAGLKFIVLSEESDAYESKFNEFLSSNEKQAEGIEVAKATFENIPSEDLLKVIETNERYFKRACIYLEKHRSVASDAVNQNIKVRVQR